MRVKTKDVGKSDGTIIQTEAAPRPEKDRLNEALKPYPNYVGYEENAEIYTNRKPTGKKGTRIYVEKKIPKDKLKKQDLLPLEIDGKKTDVIPIGKVMAPEKVSKKPIPEGIADRKKKYRPIPPGVSHGNIKITAGTPGGVLVLNGRKQFATNTHVGCESIRKDLSDQDRRNVQQGVYDGGTVNDRYGNVSKAIIMPEGNPAFNDFCVVDVEDQDDISPPLFETRVVPKGTTTIEVGDRVWKEGRTTGLTYGTVISTSANLNVNYRNEGTVFHTYCIVTSDMSDGGDSGSWIYKKESDGNAITDEDRCVTAYLFAGSDTHTVCHEIHNAVSAVGASVYTEDDPTPPPKEIEVNVRLEPTGSGGFRVYGKVVNDDTGNGIPNASVALSSGTTTSTTTTDDDGLYTLPNNQYGLNYTLRFEAPEYNSKIVELGVVG